MSVTVTTQKFPDGTAVGAYDATGYTTFPTNGPASTAVETKTASAGKVTFTELVDNRAYFIAAKIGSEWRHVQIVANSIDPPFLHPGGGAGVTAVNGRTGAITGIEETANKDTIATLGTSDTKYPSQKAVKAYADASATNLTNANLSGSAGITATNLKGEITDAKLLKPTIVGKISAAGAVVAGSGFTAEKTATGVYTITLSTELATEGAMVVTVEGAANNFARVVEPGKKVFKVVTFSLSPLEADTPFHFMIKAT